MTRAAVFLMTEEVIHLTEMNPATSGQEMIIIQVISLNAGKKMKMVTTLILDSLRYLLLKSNFKAHR